MTEVRLGIDVAKTDRLDSRVLARLPMLHPEGLRAVDGLGPAEPLRRAVLKRLGRKRLATLLIRTSRGAFREAKADELLAAADETIELWAAGGLNFAELAEDIAAEVRVIKSLDVEFEAIEDRIDALYDDADPNGIVRSAPGLGVTLAAGILGRTGDLNRFANLAGVRSFTGIVPKIDQSGLAGAHKGLTKAGDPGLRQALYLAAEHARKVDPTLAARYHRLIVEQGKHHVSAVCTIAAVLITRIAACWRNGQHYVLRDLDGREITEAEGRAICTERYTIPANVRAARRRTTTAKHHKQPTSQRNKESTNAAPATGPSTAEPTEKVA